MEGQVKGKAVRAGNLDDLEIPSAWHCFKRTLGQKG